MEDEPDWGGRILAGLLLTAFGGMGAVGLTTSRDWQSALFCAVSCLLGAGIVFWVMKEPSPIEDEDPPA